MNEEGLVKSLIDSLAVLTRADLDDSDGAIIDVFYNLYEVGLVRVEIVDHTDRNSIASLLKTVLPNMKTFVEDETDTFPSTTFECSCVVRSGLQFLLDNYRDFPTLNKSLEEFKSSLDLEEFDDCFENYTPGIFDISIDLQLVSTQIEKLPSHHYRWWSRGSNLGGTSFSHRIKNLHE